MMSELQLAVGGPDAGLAEQLYPHGHDDIHLVKQLT
jgi:hypothetical protein